jgi:hypothetical protein
LHLLSKDLRTLKHLFESYMIVIDKILAATQRTAPPSAADLRASLLLRSDTTISESLVMSSDPERNVFLASSALQRFDRLRDRLKVIMLNTIDGHFEEINALQQTVSHKEQPPSFSFSSFFSPSSHTSAETDWCWPVADLRHSWGQ